MPRRTYGGAFTPFQRHKRYKEYRRTSPKTPSRARRDVDRTRLINKFRQNHPLNTVAYSDNIQAPVNLFDMYTPEAITAFTDKYLYYNDADFARSITSSPNWVNEYKSNIENALDATNPNHLGYALDPEMTAQYFHTIIQSSLTNALRPLLHHLINMIDMEMSRYGKLIISGGEAFNLNVKKQFREITPDIDTKFIPLYGYDRSEGMTQGLFNAFMLQASEQMWYVAMEKATAYANSRKVYRFFYENVLYPLEQQDIFRALHVKFLTPEELPPEDGDDEITPICRKHSYICRLVKKKSGRPYFICSDEQHPCKFRLDKKNYISQVPFRKRKTVLSKDMDRNILFDIELFAIDLYMNNMMRLDYVYSLENDQVEYTGKFVDDYLLHVSGMLDMPFMRPGELGYNLINPENHTTFEAVTDMYDLNFLICPENSLRFRTLNMIQYRGPITTASVHFLREDIHIMQRYGLRSDAKRAKDMYRERVLADVNNLANNKIIPPLKHIATTSIQEFTCKELDNVVFNDNISPISIGKIIRFLAPPFHAEFQPDGLLDLTKCTQMALSLEVKQNRNISEIEGNLVSSRFDYYSGEWIDCCDDGLRDLFRVRIDHRSVAKQLDAADPYKRTQIVQELQCWLNEILEYIKHTPRDKEANVARNHLGKLLYLYNDTNNFDECVLVTTLINNILITVSSLRFVPDDELRPTGVAIIAELEDIWTYYKKNRKKIVYPEACATILN